MNAKFQIAVHILTLLHQAKGELYPSEYIAGSINANAALVRKELSNLRNHGLVESKEGKTGGYTLGRVAELITLADVYAAVKSATPFGLAKNQPNPDCPVGKQVNTHVMALYKDVDQSIIKHLNHVTLADFSKNFD